MSRGEAFEITIRGATAGNALSTQCVKRGPPSHVVIETVSGLNGTDPERVTPLYDIVDPDALDRLFQSVDDNESRTGIELSFSYAGYDVTITGDRDVLIEETS